MEQAKLNAVKEIFDFSWDADVSAEPNNKGGWDIKIASMYETPTYKGEGGLLGLVTALQQATGCSTIDIIDEFAVAGCDTCDYGSSYGKVYRVW